MPKQPHHRHHAKLKTNYSDNMAADLNAMEGLTQQVHGRSMTPEEGKILTEGLKEMTTSDRQLLRGINALQP